MVAGRGIRAAHCITASERGILEVDGVIENSKRQMKSHTRRVYMSGMIELLYVGMETNLDTHTVNFGRVC